MTQTTALLVHELMDNPDAWREKSTTIITNGYYDVWLDGSRYGMGTASYEATPADRNVISQAVAYWKKETGWKPREEVEEQKKPSQVNLAPDGYIRQNYEEFARSIRSTHKSFLVHGDKTVFAAQVQQAISNLDSFLRPMEQIEGKKSNADRGGVPSA